jgi:hypothetical protein
MIQGTREELFTPPKTKRVQAADEALKRSC